MDGGGCSASDHRRVTHRRNPALSIPKRPSFFRAAGRKPRYIHLTPQSLLLPSKSISDFIFSDKAIAKGDAVERRQCGKPNRFEFRQCDSSPKIRPGAL